MLALLVALSLNQTAPRVAVVDVSAPDAIYEDVSRELAAKVAAALNEAGFDAVRVDESQLPPGGCRIGPCLGEVAKAQKAKVVVILDATELDKHRSGVGVAGLWGVDGQPLATARFVVTGDKLKPAKALERFGAELKKRVRALSGARDAG
jgi:hypothetical protein